MAEENIDEHHEVEKPKTITMKKSTLWGIVIFALLALLVASIFTGGFGLTKSSSATGNAANTNTGATIDTKIFTSNPNLYPSLGPDNAKYTVIEFVDFQCPVCGLASGSPSWISQYAGRAGVGVAGQLEELAKQGKIRFITVTMSFLGQGSVYATEAGLCANDQGKFWEMYDAIFANQVPPEQEGAQFTKSQLETIASNIKGLDTSKFNNCLEKDEHLSDGKIIAQAAVSTGVSGTPTFIINGQIVQNWPSVISLVTA